MATNLPPPTSQKAGDRPISFLLTGGQGADVSLSLSLRPEDLNRQEPSRANPQNTFGGAWLDNWGPGLGSLVISGHTGWRGTAKADGYGQFLQLRDTVFTQFHARREAAVQAGTDPDSVKLIYADSLDAITVRVMPMLFSLKRNRTRPLLYMYQINMTVLGDDVAPPTTETDAVSSPPSSQFANGIASLQSSLGQVQSFIGQVNGVINSVAAPFRQVLGIVNSTVGLAQNALGTVDTVISGTTGELCSFAHDICLTARNACYLYNAVAVQDPFLEVQVSELASALDNLVCLFTNVFSPSWLFPDFSDIYGSSNCSSTAGGLPLSPLLGTNAFESLVPLSASPIAVSPQAQAAMNSLMNADPVLQPQTMTGLGQNLQDVADGVTLV